MPRKASLFDRRLARCALFSALLAASGAQATEFSGLAQVNDDATLSIRNRKVVLWGIHIPRTAEDCNTFTRPPECGARAVLALKFKIEGFVHCVEQEKRRRGVVIASCRADQDAFDEGLDLAGYLIEQGWAVALPDAPFEYQVLERIARQTGRGVWGIPGIIAPLYAPGR